MLNFFDMVGEALISILDFFSLIGTFISNLVTGLITALSLLSGVATIPVIFTGYVPGIISSAILVFLTLGIIKFVVGR